MKQVRRSSIVGWIGVSLLLCATPLLIVIKQNPQSRTDHTQRIPPSVQKVVDQVAALEAIEAGIAQTSWATELLAQRCSSVFDALWDSINAATNKFEPLQSFAAREIALPSFHPAQEIGHGIKLYTSNGTNRLISIDGSRRLLDQFQMDGWAITQTEFRHIRFMTNGLGEPSDSGFYIRIDGVNSRKSMRTTLEGNLRVYWSPSISSNAPPGVNSIDASQLNLRVQTGIPAYQLEFLKEVRPVEKTHFIDPLILYDLDEDGLPEIILAAKNLVLKRLPDGSFAEYPLCNQNPGLLLTATMADFDCDGCVDFLGAVFDGLLFFKGSPGGHFEDSARMVWKANPRLKYAQVLTAGDIDHDGDLDLWLGQYKNPYEQGQMPAPYYDANDGNSSHLLLNDGQANFSAATETAGLGKKRWRRCYAASFIDLNNDGHLDLLTINDFAGVDAYANNGYGHFADFTEKWLPERHMFGMGHAVADFDLDGQKDILVMGMHCPTAQRLNHLGLKRPGRPDYDQMRLSMNEGNRLFMGRPGGGFETNLLGQFIRHSGWSWGCSAFDWDNDGYPDVYVVNGHETRQTVKEYEPEFWLHDIYVGDSREDLVVNAYFRSKIARTRGHGWSYGGYEKNRLFQNIQGKSFVEIGHLLGVAVEEDSRNLATGDLDGDGRIDLVLTTFEAWPKVRQTVRVFHNNLQNPGNWIGFRFREQGNGVSPVGATASVYYQEKAISRPIITGDSHRSQHPNILHFGLGQNTHIDRVDIKWQNGQKITLKYPKINCYHLVESPVNEE